MNAAEILFRKLSLEYVHSEMPGKEIEA